LETYALYVTGDASHARWATHTLELPSAASFMDIDALITIVKSNKIDAVHPGYGFLSESGEFAKKVWENAGAVVIGPGWKILERTGDKIRARQLAEECQVPVCPALRSQTSNIEAVRKFAFDVGYPIMVKAVDGGGGRGIRLVCNDDGLPTAVKRAIEESPSKQVFAEKAAIDGFRHIEVQVIGDGLGKITHLWERECSIQRRYQKIVEVAPSVVSSRKVIAQIIEDALRMAQTVSQLDHGALILLMKRADSIFFIRHI
jgi:pyruvate carboxylase